MVRSLGLVTHLLDLKMQHYSNEPRKWIFVKGYCFFYLAKNIVQNIGINLGSK